MKLTVLERILLLNILPTEGDLTTITIVRELREALSFSEEEHKKAKLKTNAEGRITWKDSFEKTVEIKGKALEIARHALNHLNDEKKLNVGHISLYEKIVGDK